MNHIADHPAFAEDQPHAYLLLTTHVLHRAITVGSLFGILYGGGRFALSSSARAATTLPAALLRSSSTGVLVSSGINALALAGRMYGREEIEWKDRSWRLLESRGQNQTDEWSVAGMLGGAVGGVAVGRTVGVAAYRAAVGGAGAGSVLGVVAMMAWRQVGGGEK